MIKRSQVLTLILIVMSLTTYHLATELIEKPINFKSSIHTFPVTCLLQKRIFLIGSLKKPMQLLQTNTTIHTLLQTGDVLTSLSDTPPLQDPQIKECKKQLEQYKDTTKLFAIWHHLNAYGSIYNTTLAEDFVRLVLSIYRNLFIVMLTQKETEQHKTKEHMPTMQEINELYNQLMKISANEALDYLSALSDICQQCTADEETCNIFPWCLPDMSRLEIPKQTDINVEHISHRIIRTRRLKKSITVLQALETAQHAALSSAINVLSSLGTKNNASPFRHYIITNCIKKITENNTLQPLFLLNEKLKHFRAINDFDLVRELIVLLYIIFKNILAPSVESNQEGISLDDVFATYNEIIALPVEQILDSMDAMVEKINALVERYELSQIKKWVQWLKKYGPPTGIVIAVLAVIAKKLSST